ncbi:MAG: hypothetical protein N2260_08730 [Syntrophobacterales bacterium]|nr:hypothetical protein [Syntrophobacterales bacterium]
MLSFFKNILKSNQGLVPLAVAVVVGVTLGWLYLAGTTAQRIRETSGRAVEDLIENPANAPIEPAERHRQNLSTFSQVLGTTGGMVNSVATSIGPGGGADVDPVNKAWVLGVQNTRDVTIDRVLSESTSNPPTSSNPLPSDVRQSPSCSRTSLQACSSRSSCSSAGGTWQPNNTCSTNPVPACRRSNLAGCTNATECGQNGGYWYNSKCNASPQCSSSNVRLCKTEAECTRVGGFWYDNQCNTSSRECYINVVLCRTRVDCESAGGYWYDNACHMEAKCANQGGVVSCENGQEICASNVCDRRQDCRDGSDEWTCDCDESGVYVCGNGKKICRFRVCNGKDECGDGSDERNCQSAQSCCVLTRGCPGETASQCAQTCCCCPYGQVCDRVNLFRGCITVGMEQAVGASFDRSVVCMKD